MAGQDFEIGRRELMQGGRSGASGKYGIGDRPSPCTG